MINKKYIRQYLLLPLLACLMAGAAGCSSDASEGDDNGKQTAGSGTYLIINARAINIDEPTSDMETYVSCIRVIGFNANGEQICNGLHGKDNITINGIGENATATITQEIAEKGVATLYFIANEKWEGSNGYEVSTSGSSNYYLSETLANTDLTEKQLNEIILHYTPASYAKGVNPFLMVAKQTVLISGASQSIGIVELERVFAKLTVIFKMEEGATTPLSGTITELKLQNGNEVPYLFNLTGEKTKASPATSFMPMFDWLNTYITSANAGLSESNNTFSVYVPERILSDGNTNEANAWQLSIKVLTGNGRTVSGVIALSDEAVTDYNIYRNHVYEVTSYIPDKDPLRLILNVIDWTPAKEQEIEWSKSIDYDLNSTINTRTENGETFYPIYHTTVGEGQQQGIIQFTFNLKAPVGARWSASLSNGNDFEFVDDNASTGIGGQGAQTFQIRAKNATPPDNPDLYLAIRVYSDADGWDRIMLNKDESNNSRTSSGNDDLILIRQVEN